MQAAAFAQNDDLTRRARRGEANACSQHHSRLIGEGRSHRRCRSKLEKAAQMKFASVGSSAAECIVSRSLLDRAPGSRPMFDRRTRPIFDFDYEEPCFQPRSRDASRLRSASRPWACAEIPSAVGKSTVRGMPDIGFSTRSAVGLSRTAAGKQVSGKQTIQSACQQCLPCLCTPQATVCHVHSNHAPQGLQR